MHGGLNGLTPLARYQQDLPRVRTLGTRAAQLDQLFLHRISRKVKKDGTVSYLGQQFEVPFELSGKTVQLVVDPHAQKVVGVENAQGEAIGQATPLNALANATRKRRTPTPVVELPLASGPNLVELAYRQYHGLPGE